MEELKSDNVDLLVYHQHNQVEQLKSELDSKKMLFSKNCIKISKVVGQGRYSSKCSDILILRSSTVAMAFIF